MGLMTKTGNLGEDGGVYQAQPGYAIHFEVGGQDSVVALLADLAGARSIITKYNVVVPKTSSGINDD
jgi:hypothetical protein